MLPNHPCPVIKKLKVQGAVASLWGNSRFNEATHWSLLISYFLVKSTH